MVWTGAAWTPCRAQSCSTVCWGLVGVEVTVDTLAGRGRPGVSYFCCGSRSLCWAVISLVDVSGEQELLPSQESPHRSQGAGGRHRCSGPWKAHWGGAAPHTSIPAVLAGAPGDHEP